jgi:hypothetical protein
MPRRGRCRGRARTSQELTTATEEPAGAPGQAGGAGQARPPVPGPRRPPGRYGLLLVILICSYLLSAFITSKWITDTQLVLFTAAGLLAIRGVRMRRALLRLVVPAGFLVSLLMVIVADHEGGDIGRGVASLWGGALLLFIVVVILGQILAAPAVTAQSIYGAISAYLIIGLMFSAFYGAMYFFHGHAFFAGGQPGSTSNFQYSASPR